MKTLKKRGKPNTEKNLGGKSEMSNNRGAATRAVRNRKKFFCDMLNALCKEAPNGLSVLNLASGPCRDVAEAIVQADSKAAGSHFHCVDIDESYRLCERYSSEAGIECFV